MNTPLSDHAEATAALFEWFAAQIRAGVPREDLGRLVTLVGRILERRT